MDQCPADRTARITNAPERLAPLAAEDLDERHHAAIERLRVFYDDDEGEPLHSFYGILAHSPEFFAGYMDLGIAITASCALPGRSRELLILRTGWLCGAPYQWGEHVRIARDHGLSSEDVERVVEGSAAAGWNDQDRALLSAAEELHADAMIADATWQALAQFLDQRQLLEVPIVVGHYHTTAFLQNAVRVALNGHNPGLSAR